MAEAGLDPLAGYTPPYEAAQRDTPLAARYPLALIAGADHYFLNSALRERPAPDAALGAAIVRIHPDDAAARGSRPGRGPRLQRPRRVRRARRGHGSRPPRRGRQHQGPMASLREGRRDRQRHRGRTRRRHGRRGGLPRQPRGGRADSKGDVAVPAGRLPSPGPAQAPADGTACSALDRRKLFPYGVSRPRSYDEIPLVSDATSRFPLAAPTSAPRGIRGRETMMAEDHKTIAETVTREIVGGIRGSETSRTRSSTP